MPAPCAACYKWLLLSLIDAVIRRCCYAAFARHIFAAAAQHLRRARDVTLPRLSAMRRRRRRHFRKAMPPSLIFRHDARFIVMLATADA